MPFKSRSRYCRRALGNFRRGRVEDLGLGHRCPDPGEVDLAGAEIDAVAAAGIAAAAAQAGLARLDEADLARKGPYAALFAAYAEGKIVEVTSSGTLCFEEGVPMAYVVSAANFGALCARAFGAAPAARRGGTRRA